MWLEILEIEMEVRIALSKTTTFESRLEEMGWTAYVGVLRGALQEGTNGKKEKPWKRKDACEGCHDDSCGWSKVDGSE